MTDPERGLTDELMDKAATEYWREIVGYSVDDVVERRKAASERMRRVLATAVDALVAAARAEGRREALVGMTSSPHDATCQCEACAGPFDFVPPRPPAATPTPSPEKRVEMVEQIDPTTRERVFRPAPPSGETPREPTDQTAPAACPEFEGHGWICVRCHRHLSKHRAPTPAPGSRALTALETVYQDLAESCALAERTSQEKAATKDYASAALNAAEASGYAYGALRVKREIAKLSAALARAETPPVADDDGRCLAEERHRDGRGLWAERRCTLKRDHPATGLSRHAYSRWKYHPKELIEE